jgi:hypothetical protein
VHHQPQREHGDHGCLAQGTSDGEPEGARRREEAHPRGARANRRGARQQTSRPSQI